MTRVLLSLAYLPPVSWWAVALKYGNVSLEYCETYPKQTYRNRCHILGANGLMPLSIPVIKVNGNHTMTSGIRIDYSRNWQNIHWRSIEAAYGKAPYFLYYKDFFEPVYSGRIELLADLNLTLIKIIAKVLKRGGIVFEPTSEFNPAVQIPDYRQRIHPKKPPLSFGSPDYARYMQVFESSFDFLPDLSIIDLIFNQGPSAVYYLRDLASGL